MNQVETRYVPSDLPVARSFRVTYADGNSTEAIHATGQIKLPATLPTGDYALELSVYDRLEKTAQQRAAQWVDFTLAK